MSHASDLQPTVSFNLETTIDSGMGFMGKGGSIDSQGNPNLQVAVGDIVGITLTNGDGVEHDFTISDLNLMTPHLISKGASEFVVFKVEKAGEFPDYCSLPGHRQAGMQGKLVVGLQDASAGATAASVVHNPVDLPAPVGYRPAQRVAGDLLVSNSLRMWGGMSNAIAILLFLGMLAARVFLINKEQRISR